MADGDDRYSLRKTTMNTRIEREKAEEDRIRKRLREIERRRMRDEDLAVLSNQREQLLRQRSRRFQHSSPVTGDVPSFITVDDDVETSHHEDIDLSAETKHLDGKLRELRQDSRDEENEERDLSKERFMELEKSIRKLKEDIFSKEQTCVKNMSLQEKITSVSETDTQGKRSEGTVVDQHQAARDKPQITDDSFRSPKLQTGLEMKLKKIEKWSQELIQKEDDMRRKEMILNEKEAELNEYWRQQDSKMKQCEERIEQLQVKMNDRMEELEYSFREKEYRLKEHQRCLDEEYEIRQSQMDDMEKKLLERELAIRDRQKFEYKKPYDTESKFREEAKEEKETCSNLHMGDHLNVKLNLTPFSGKEPVPKHESSFEEFKLEFESVRHIYSEQVLKQALRKTLKEQARKTMLHLGTHATVGSIMKSLEENFGNVASEDSILSRFLLAEQNADESIVEWGLRLEEMLLQVCRKSGMDETEKRMRLKNRFWRGLRGEELKQATRAYFDGPMAYEELRNKVRSEEFEIKLLKERSGARSKTGKLSQTSVEKQTSQTDDMITKLLKQMQELDRKFEVMKKAQEEQSWEQKAANRHPRGGYRGSRRGGNRGYDRGRERENSDRKSYADVKETSGERRDKGEKKPLNG